MSLVCEKGAISNLINGSKNLPLHMTLFEVIDNRSHSNSNKVFIDINLHNKKCVIGFSEKTDNKNITNMVMWYNINKKHNEYDNISCRGAGLKLWEFLCTGEYTHVTKNKEGFYYKSEINTTEIWKAEINKGISSIEFSNILNSETRVYRRLLDEIVESEINIFNNINNYYPFKANTLIIGKKINDDGLLSNILNKEDGIKNLITNLKIKYYDEISKGFELYIKLPKFEKFEKITNESNGDIIGYTNNNKNKYKINIYISPIDTLGYIIEVKNKFYKFKKNGNTYLVEKKININKYNNPDYIFYQYNVKNIDKTKIIGNSLEDYAGVYINLGNTFISSIKVNWEIRERSLIGSKDYRGVLYINSLKGKNNLSFSGLKAQFNMANNKIFHTLIKLCTNIYSRFFKYNKRELNYKKNINVICQDFNPDNYILIKKSSSKKSSKEHNINGYIYIINIGINFYKFGYSKNKERIFDYNNKETINNIKNDFKKENIYDEPILIFLNLNKKNKIRLREEKIKEYINKSQLCSSYESKKSVSIREYFSCDKIHLIMKDINNIVYN